MRAFYFLGFAGAAVLGAGAFAFGCSSSSNNTTTNTDASTADVAADDAAACNMAPVNVATFDSGSTSWACYQAECQTELTACANDCSCNSAVFAALTCAADAGPSDQILCFAPVASIATGGPALTCLQANKQANATCQNDASTDAGTTSDAASDAAATDAAATDAGIADAATGG